MSETILESTFECTPEEQDQRLDQVLAARYSAYSRATWQKWIQAGFARVNQNITPTKYKLRPGDLISIEVQIAEPAVAAKAQAIPLEIVFKDADLLIINKPAGLVVHPAAGNPDGTLVNALLHHDPQLAELPRAGIIHRLDKETSGLLMVGRNLKSYTALVRQLQERSVTREYKGIAQGYLTAGGTIDADMGRHPKERLKMAVRTAGGKPAVTHYRIAERLTGYTLLDITLETGRTHQIRVHLAHIKHPLLGDPLYAGRSSVVAGLSEPVREAVKKFKRQALHAARLGLIHPTTGEYQEWKSPVPEDFQQLLELLRG